MVLAFASFAKIFGNFAGNNSIKNIITENEISKIVFDAALKVHKALGPGLLENAYEECLYYELKKTGIHVEKQKPLP